MRVITVNDKLSVAGQPAQSDFAGLAAAGYVAIINDRADGEDANQPGSRAEEQAAHEAGLVYVHIPLRGFGISHDAVRRFQAAVDAAPGPVLAHCKSGARALALHAVGEVLSGRMTIDEVCEFGERFGFNLEAAEDWLSENVEEGVA